MGNYVSPLALAVKAPNFYIKSNGCNEFVYINVCQIQPQKTFGHGKLNHFNWGVVVIVDMVVNTDHQCLQIVCFHPPKYLMYMYYVYIRQYERLNV